MKRHTALFERMRYSRCKCGCDRSVIKGTLLGEQSVFSSLYRFPLEGFSSNVKPHTLNACATNAVGVVAVGQ